MNNNNLPSEDESSINNDIEISFSSDNDDMEHCAICLDFQNCESIVMECCNKLIHSYCLAQWLSQRNNCPLCRTQQSTHYNSLSNSNLHNNQLEEIDTELSNLFDTFLNRNNASLGITSFRDNFSDPASGSGGFLSNLSRFQRRNAFLAPYPSRPPRAPRARRRGFYFPLDQNIELGVTFPWDEDLELGVTRYEQPNLGTTRNREPMVGIGTFINNSYNNMENIYNNMMSHIGVSSVINPNDFNFYSNGHRNLGISYVNEDLLDDLGISSVNVETDFNNNININLNNGDLNINFNLDQNNPINSITNLLNTLTQEMNTLNNHLNNIYSGDDSDDDSDIDHEV